MNATLHSAAPDRGLSRPSVEPRRKPWLRYSESRLLAYAFFAAVYILPNVYLARTKLIWDDEFFTLYLSKINTWSELWRALATGADQHPPSFYYLTHLILELAAPSHLTLRLTALVGFGMTCVCLYEIVRKLLSARWAIAAMILPMTSPLLYYATEARGYGLELGFVTLSLWMWILAQEKPRKPWLLPAFAAGLCLAVASHYYAILFVGALAAGELVKAIIRRRLDLPVYCSFLAAFIPLFCFAPIVLKAKTYSTHFWAVPFWGSMLQWYPETLGRLPLVLLAVAGLTFVLRLPGSPNFDQRQVKISLPVTTAICACALLPVAGGIIAELFTHAFTARYFIAALPGIVVLLLWGARRILRNDAIAPALVSAICLILFVQEWRDLRANQLSSLRELRSVATLLRHSGTSPVVMSEVTLQHQLSFYARRDLASRLVYLADPHLSVRYIGHDTIDRGLLDLVPWFPLRIVWWHEWWQTHSSSLIYGYVGAWSWPTFAINQVGTSKLMARDIDHLLLDVTRTAIPPDDRGPGDPLGKPLLYDTLPQNGRTLCSMYLPNDGCPDVDDPRFKQEIISYPDRLEKK
jgi:hypothetical protein